MLSVCKMSLVCSSAGTSCHHSVSVRGQSLTEANLASSHLLYYTPHISHLNISCHTQPDRCEFGLDSLVLQTLPLTSQYFMPHAEMQNIKYEANVWQRPTWPSSSLVLHTLPLALNISSPTVWDPHSQTEVLLVVRTSIFPPNILTHPTQRSHFYCYHLMCPSQYLKSIQRCKISTQPVCHPGLTCQTYLYFSDFRDTPD